MDESFSVLISLYIKENPIWLREAFDSVFSQTVQPSEIILVEDGPLTKELETIVEEYSVKYPIFKIIKNEKNIGLGLSLRKGVCAANNEIIARMDTDDTMPNDRFEKQLRVIHKGYDLISCWSQIYNEDMTQIIATKYRPESHDDIVKLAKRRSPVCHAACMFRKSAVLRAGNYQHCNFYEDYNLWVRMIQTGSKFFNIQEVLYYVRTTNDQLKRRGGLKYLLNELSVFKLFYRMKFFSKKDLIINSLIRIFARLIPNSLRAFLFKCIWNFKTKI